ncbi:MAG: hypothetical protein ABIU18_07115, partial [Novosphingobium sp.]
MFLIRAILAPASLLVSLIGTLSALPVFAESPARPMPVRQALVPALTYADLADLADAAPLVLKAKVIKVAEVEPKRAGNVKPGWARVYVESVTENLLAGPAAVGASLHYLADVLRDAKGKVPKLKKMEVLLFAMHVEGQPGALQLIAPDAQVLFDPLTEMQLRAILDALYRPGAPRRITGVREAIHVPGNLAGEGETQIFLTTQDEEPAAITVIRHNGLPLNWSMSFSEIVESTGRPPARDTLPWYRLACFLPRQLPAGVNVSATPEDRALAETDYARVIA